MLKVMKSKGMTKQDAECIMLAVDAYMKTIGVGPNKELRKPG